jgi:hypothetical protein
MLRFCNLYSVLLQNFRAWNNTMSLNDDSITAQPKPRY